MSGHADALLRLTSTRKCSRCGDTFRLGPVSKQKDREIHCQTCRREIERLAQGGGEKHP